MSEENPIKPFIRGKVLNVAYDAAKNITTGLFKRSAEDKPDFIVIIEGDRTEEWVIGEMSPRIPSMQVQGQSKGRDVYKRAGKVSDEDGKEPTILECSNEEYLITAVCTLLSYQTGDDPAVSLDSVRQVASQWKALGYFK